MSEIQSFKDLDVWKVSMELLVVTHKLARRLPPEERYVLSAQMRKSAVSIPSTLLKVMRDAMVPIEATS